MSLRHSKNKPIKQINDCIEANHKKYLEKNPMSQLWFTQAKAREWLF